MFFKALLSALASTAVIGQANAFSGDATYYHTGLGACGAWSNDGDYVALPPGQYKQGSNCWRHIGVEYQGRVIDATVVDLCPGCAGDSIDLSPVAFQGLASLDAGRIMGKWWYH